MVKRMKSIHYMVKEENSDIIVLTGDFVESQGDNRKRVLAILK